MSDIHTVEASPELLYVFFRSIADLPSHLLPLAGGYGLSRNQLARIRSLSVQDFRRLRQLCPIYYRAVSVSVKIRPELLDETLRALEAAITTPLVGNGEPTSDFLALRALLLYVNSLPGKRLDAVYALGLSREQVRRIRELPVCQLNELHKLETRLCTAARIKMSLVGELLDRLLKGLSMDRYQQALQEALLARGAPFELMRTLFAWTQAEYDDRRRGYPEPATAAASPVEQLRAWVAWEEARDQPSEAERYLTVAQNTGLPLDRIWSAVGNLDKKAGQVLLGLLGQWEAERPGQAKALPGFDTPLPAPYLAAIEALDEQSNLPDFVGGILRVMRELTGAASAGFLLCEEATADQPARLILLAADGLSLNVMQAAQGFPLQGSFTGTAIQRRRVEQGVVTRMAEINEPLVDALAADGQVHAMSLPLLHGRRAIGAINLHSPHQLSVSAEQATWLLQLGQHIARRLNALQTSLRLAEAV